MKNSLVKTQNTLAVSCALALGIISGAAVAATDPVDTSYLGDQRGGVVRSGTGLCWHTAYGPAAATPNECEPGVPAAAAAPAPAPAPAAIAAVTPTPAPKATPKPVADRVTLDADALFDFNKSNLRPAGKVALDDFVSRIRGYNLEVITAVGHADRFGTDGYNQRLSEQRVATVRSYLLGKGIAQDRIHTEGKGESQPVTKAGDCAGAKSAKVIACLQPDRRVEVEVVGTRTASTN